MNKSALAIGSAQVLVSRAGAPPLQSPATIKPSPESSSSSYERIQHVLLSQASVAAQKQSHSQTQHPFPPRRPLRHQPPTPFIQQQSSFPQRLRELPTASHFLSAPAVSSVQSASVSVPSVTPTLGPAARSPAAVGSGALLDGMWRGMLERIYGELAHVRTLYAGALRKEQQEKEVFRAHCIRLKGERDLAREKLRRVFGRKYDDGTQLPAGDASNTAAGSSSSSVTGATHGETKDQIRTPPLSASFEVMNFPSSIATVAEQISNDIIDELVASTEQVPGDPIDVRSYPSPSPSCASPPSPLRSPTLPRDAPWIGSANPEQIAARDDANDINPTVLGDLSQVQERKRGFCDEESGDETSGKRRRTQESEGSCSSVATSLPQADNSELVDEEAGDVTDTPSITQPSISAESAISNRWNISFDLMYMLADDKVVCRVCSYKHARSDAPAPTAFPRTTSWEDLSDHCEQQHPAACAEIAKMGPGEVMELRQRMVSTTASSAKTSAP